MSERIIYARHLIHGNEIRILELKPGAKEDALEAAIRYRKLNDNPKYKALSYTWSNPFTEKHDAWRSYDASPARYQLKLDGNTVAITTNLHSALIRIRQPSAAQLLWVDALSIDQNNDEEKSSQIQMMRTIYEKAQRVFIWLGPADATSDVGMTMLQAGYRYALRCRPYRTSGSVRVNLPAPRTDQEYQDQLQAASLAKLFGEKVQSDAPIPDYPIEAVANILNRAYWGRGWCWQEFVVAQKISILCGGKLLENAEMAMDAFLQTWDRWKTVSGRQPYGLNHRPWAMMDCRRAYRNMVYLQSIFTDDPSIQTPDMRPLAAWVFESPAITDTGKAWFLRYSLQKLSMKELLEESSRCWLETGLKHDQLFALLNLATDAADLRIIISYSVSWEVLYTKIMMAYLERGGLWFLNYCQGHQEIRSANLPSWVPDWSFGYRGALLSSHWTPEAAHLGTKEAFVVPSLEKAGHSGEVILRGVIVDEVVWMTKERTPMSVNDLDTPRRQDLYWWIRNVTAACSDLERRVIWSTMIANTVDLPVPGKYEKCSRKELQKMLDLAFESILNQDLADNHELGLIIECFLRCFMQATAYRSIFRTASGRIGLAHAGAQPGDRIAVFMGNNTAFVVRPHKRERYTIYSESYVHDLMENEEVKARVAVEEIRLI